MSTLMQRIMAARLGQPVPAPASIPPPSNAAFEAKREQWRTEALRKAREPAPPPAPVTSSAPKQVEAPPPAPPAGHVGSLTSRGSCKAINAETGRQCALLAGHTKPHRHGSTDFVRVATPGQSSFARRDALDALAAASNPTTPGEAQ